MDIQELQSTTDGYTRIQVLEKKICELISQIYQANYIGYLKVEYLNPGYKLILGIPSYMAQTSIATDIDDEVEFIDFIEKEIKSRNYLRQEYYKVIRTSGTIEE